MGRLFANLTCDRNGHALAMKYFGLNSQLTKFVSCSQLTADILQNVLADVALDSKVTGLIRLLA